MDWISEFRAAGARVDTWIRGMAPEDWLGPGGRAWTTDPVSMDDVLRLWLVHVGQHRTALQWQMSERSVSAHRPGAKV